MLSDVSATERPLFPNMTKLKDMYFDMQLKKPDNDFYVN
jgi:hypothetical protein